MEIISILLLTVSVYYTYCSIKDLIMYIKSKNKNSIIVESLFLLMMSFCSYSWSNISYNYLTTNSYKIQYDIIENKHITKSVHCDSTQVKTKIPSNAINVKITPCQ